MSLRRNVNHAGSKTCDKYDEHRFTSYRIILVFEKKFCATKAFNYRILTGFIPRRK